MFSDAVLNTFRAYALAEFPREACGFIVAGNFEPKNNISDTPERDFRISDADYLDAVGRGLEAVLHSHPNGTPYPSGEDMQGQLATAVAWGICTVMNECASPVFLWGDTVPIPPLVGRDFRHGVTDCYSLIRDWYRLERGITLPEYPRDMDWWHSGQNLYWDYFRDAGFRVVTDGPQVGDVFLAQIYSKVLNHAGIYIGDGLILHHLQNRLSKRDPAFSWRKYLNTWLRHSSNPS